MVHLFDQETTVLTLDQFGEERFVQELLLLDAENGVYDKRNHHWFKELAVKYKDPRYVQWFFLMDGDDVAAFASIQNPYPGCYRVMGRLYIYREYRRFTQLKDDTYLSPSMRLMKEQLNYLKEFDTLYVSFQTPQRQKHLPRIKKKFERWTPHKWNMMEDMMLVCPDPKSSECWQAVLYAGVKPTNPTITVEEWNIRYGKNSSGTN